MKRTLFSFILFFLASAAGMKAQYVSVDEARQKAIVFIQENSSETRSVRDSELKLVYEETDPVQTKSAESSLFYIFNINDSDGFVIVSADERTTSSIIGYSFDNNFKAENMPVNLRNWLNSYGKQIIHLRKSVVDKFSTQSAIPRVSRQGFNSLPLPQILGSIDDTIQLVREDSGIIYPSTLEFSQSNDLSIPRLPELRDFPSQVKPLITTIWAQSKPFYNNLPKSGSERCLTGCTATAMGQVMYFYRWPDRGQGSKSYKTESLGLSVSANFDTPYDWNNMLESYKNNRYTEVQGEAVAKLLGHVSIALETDLSPEGSSAYANKVSEALVKYFKYNPSATFASKSQYNNSEWNAMLKNELSNGFPVMYRGQGDSGGHMFICDGYEKSGKYHFNWGWSGYCDGYFSLGLLNPDKDMDFTLRQGMIFQIRPNINGGGGSEGEEDNNPRLVVTKKPWMSKTSIEKGETVTLKAQIKNMGKGEYYDKLGFFLANTSQPSNSQTYYSSKKRIGPNKTIELSLTTKVDLEEGNYKVRVCYIKDKIAYSIPEPFSIINIGKGTTPDDPDKPAAFEFEIIKKVFTEETQITEDKEVTFSVELRNIGDGDYNDMLGVLIEDVYKPDNNYQIIKGPNQYVKAGENCAYSVTSKIKVKSGRYNVFPLFKRNDKYYYLTKNPTRIRIYAKPLNKGNRIKVLEAFKPDKSDITEGDDVKFSAQIKNGGDEMVEYFGIYFVNKDKPNILHAVRSSGKMKFPGNTTAPFQTNAIPMYLEPGTYNVYFMYSENGNFYYVESPYSTITISSKEKVSLIVEQPYTPNSDYIKVNDNVKFTTKIHNTSNVDYNGPFGLYFASRSDKNEDFHSVTSKSFVVKAAQRTTFNYTLQVKVVPGVYDLYFTYLVDGECVIIEDPCQTITVYSEEEKKTFNLEVTKAFIPDLDRIEENDFVTFYGCVKNIGNGAFQNGVGLYFIDCNNPQNTLIFGGREQCLINPGRDMNMKLGVDLKGVSPGSYKVYFFYATDRGAFYIENPHSTITIFPKRDKTFKFNVIQPFSSAQTQIEQNSQVRFESIIENVGNGDYNDFMGVYIEDRNNVNNTQLATIPSRINVKAGERTGIWANVFVELKPGVYNVYFVYVSFGQYYIIKNPCSTIQIVPEKDDPDDPVDPDDPDNPYDPDSPNFVCFQTIKAPVFYDDHIEEREKFMFDYVIKNIGKVDFVGYLGLGFKEKVSGDMFGWNDNDNKYKISVGESYTLKKAIITAPEKEGTYSVYPTYQINREDDWYFDPDKFSTLIVYKTSVGNEEIKAALMIIPDRSSGQIRIIGNGIQEAVLYDMGGRMISHEKYKDVSEAVLMIHSNQPQIYIVKVKVKGKVIREKIRF